MNRGIPILLLFYLFVVSPKSARGQNDTINCRLEGQVYFPTGKSSLNLDFRENQTRLDQFVLQMRAILADTSKVVTSLVVEGSASPEGWEEKNRLLAGRRAQSLADYLALKLEISPKIIKVVNGGENWAGLRTMLESSSMSSKQVLLKVMDRYPDRNSRKYAMTTFADGKPWLYMYHTFFPDLRATAYCLYQQVRQVTPPQIVHAEKAEETGRIVTVENVTSLDSLAHDSMAVPIAPATNPIFPDLSVPSKITTLYERRVFFALKTNLLFDAATLLNVELEVPIGRRWSVTGEWIFPWWLWEGQQNCLEVLSGTLEARYWFGHDINRKGDKRPVMTGWFGGFYVGGGLYDLEWKRKGYQGEFYVAAGISAGYAHAIARNLRLEYSLGIGYLQTDYRQYNAKIGGDGEWHLIRANKGRYTWIGPTRAKISLVWAPPFKVKRRGGMQ